MQQDLLLLDTNVLSLTSRQTPPPGLRQWLLDVGLDRLAVCYPVIAEILRGAHLVRKVNERRSGELQTWIEEIRAVDFAMLDMTWEVADIYGLLSSTRTLKHLWVPCPSAKHDGIGHDLMVAAVAIAHETPIITGNTKDFLKIHEVLELPGLFDPLKEIWLLPPERAIDLPAMNHGLATAI